ncbi:MAG: hypothetical protein SVU32_07310 [Candidatus Nanohaloarchaea archaeon]|nr:hypothetical protein [Candidatus Nanohaloarchaea archaeon]
MGVIQEITEKVFGSSSGQLDLQDLTLEQLNEEKANLKASVRLKRDRHEDLSQKREQLFEKIVSTDDDLLKRELAEEISSIEDEMAILHNEHTQLMDALRVVDGLISIKRKEKMMQREGLINEIRNMKKEDIVEKLRRADVREMIRDEKWDQLNSMLKGQLSPKETSNERVDEIIQQAEDIKSLEDELGTQEAVKQALQERDKKREEDRSMNV